MSAETKSLILSSAGLRNLIQNQDYNEEFTFIIGEHKIKMKNIFAEFISPYVSKIHQTDPLINIVDLTKQKGYKIEEFHEEVYSLLESLSRGNSITINRTQCYQLKIISVLLKNTELSNKLDNLFAPADKNDALIYDDIDFLNFLLKNKGMIEIADMNNTIKSIARHFYLQNDEKLAQLPPLALHSIISQDCLVVQSEDSLLEAIDNFIYMKKRFSNTDNDGVDYEEWRMRLYEEVDMLHLSENQFNEFIEKMNIENMTSMLWENLKGCLEAIFKEKSDCNHRHKFKSRIRCLKYDGNSEHAFDGIIRDLSGDQGCNVVDMGLVEVTSSSYNGSNRVPKNVVDFDDMNHYFQSKNLQDSWIQYDFKNLKVNPTHYSIRSRHDLRDGDNSLVNWKIEGSNDGLRWTTLDQRESNELIRKNAIYTFSIRNH